MDRRDKIRAAIVSFTWSNYGLDQLDELKEDPDTSEWIDGLSEHIRAHLGD